jgi:predicted nucleic acid-binding protein
VLARDERLVTSDHVLVETWFLIAHRLGWDVAEQYWEAIRGGAAHVESIGAADLEAAFAIGEAFPDQDFSIVDRTSFAVMQRLGVHRAASLDEHFAIFRFGRDRTRAFELVNA